MKLTVKRAIAFIIDVYFVAFIGMILSYVLKMTDYWIIYGVGCLFALLRDILCGGVSLGKIIMGLRVVDATTDTKAPIWKLIIRNITTPIWIVDAIIILSNDKPRLMDRALSLRVADKKEVMK